ncbi:uncharacterized protein LOC116159809 [Photinus pyralis]|uniref:uncharacterized protein LOC116159809 n=1 Tax=Photinus pyralis TaxID=7054 RepID=UPI0012675E72|nr:uncharacterized protein LOC116159809 [Photinus pyralis]
MTWSYPILNFLKSNGLSGNIYNFVKNFLNDRTFKIRLNGKLSTQRTLENGIAQGSVISTSLFLIAINNCVENISTPVKANLYADDLVIYVKGKNIHSIQKILQNTLSRLENWSKTSGFRFSTEKTKCISFTKKTPKSSPLLKLYGKTLKFEKTIRFLGIIFDQKLNWKPHIEYLKKSCYGAINLLKVLSSHHWGADTKTLLQIYQHLIRSKLDYGSISYATARKSHIKIIDTIQHSAIRIALGAFCTSPTTSMLCLANEPPLVFRRKFLTFNFAINTAAHRTRNPNSLSSTFSKKFKNEFSKNQNLSPPLYERINRLEKETNFSIPKKVLPWFNTTTPPWTQQAINTNLNLTKHPKTETPPALILAEFNCIIKSYQNYSIIYTDASKSDNRIGAAIITPKSKRKFRLPALCSTFTAEIYAILQAINYIALHQQENYVICTDSLSSILILRQIYPKNPLVQEIRRKIDNLSNSIIFLYTPSHIGIPGNEDADRTAKEATTQNTPITDLFLPNDLKNQFRKIINNQWQEKWNPTDTHLKQVKPLTQPTLPIPTKRRSQVIINRLRLGHTRMTHRFLITREDPPSCDTCQTRLTVEHLLFRCPDYTAQRNMLYSSNTNSLKALTDIESCKEIVKFITNNQITI